MSQIQSTSTGGGGGGTVTSIAAGTGITLTPNPIVGTGTVALTIPVSITDGGTNATTMTTADGVVYYDGTRLVTTTAGTATQVLTSNGAGMAPTFQAAGGGGGAITLIQKQVILEGAGADHVVFTGLASNTNYMLVYQLYCSDPSGDPAQLTLQLSTNGGASYITTGYTSSTGTSPVYTQGFVFVDNANADGNAYGASGTLYLYGLTGGNQGFAGIISGVYCEASSALYIDNTNGGSIVATANEFGGAKVNFDSTATPVNAIKIMTTFGDEIGGTFYLYGLGA